MCIHEIQLNYIEPNFFAITIFNMVIKFHGIIEKEGCETSLTTIAEKNNSQYGF